MSALTERIAAVLRAHQLSPRVDCCGCEYDSDAGYARATMMTAADHAAHMAERVEAELQLTEETHNIIDPKWQDWNKRVLAVERRWVSAWSEVQP